MSSMYEEEYMYDGLIPETRVMESNAGGRAGNELDMSDGEDGTHVTSSYQVTETRTTSHTTGGGDAGGGAGAGGVVTRVTRTKYSSGGKHSDEEEDGEEEDSKHSGGYSSSHVTTTVTTAGGGAASTHGSGPETLSPGDHGDSSNQDESIDKLRVANQALRKQLKEFSRALGAVQSSPAASPVRSKVSRRADVMRQLSDGERKLKAALKKLETYKKTNLELKKQVQGMYNPHKLTELQNERKEKQIMIKQLQEENRSLLIVQRNQTKRIEEQEHERSDWPSKVSSLMADLRVAKDKLRKAKEREARIGANTKKQHEALVRAQSKNKHLQEQLAQYEKHGSGATGADRQRRKMESEWESEKAKLEHAVAVLEKSKAQERTRGERLLRSNMSELQKVKNEMERHKAALDEKSKEIRLQMLQVKKLRRQLRELALGGDPGAEAAWKDSADDPEVQPSKLQAPKRHGAPHRRGQHQSSPVDDKPASKLRAPKQPTGKHAGKAGGRPGPAARRSHRKPAGHKAAGAGAGAGAGAPGKAAIPRNPLPKGQAKYPGAKLKHQYEPEEHDFDVDGAAHYGKGEIKHKDFHLPEYETKPIKAKSSGYGAAPAGFHPHFTPEHQKAAGRIQRNYRGHMRHRRHKGATKMQALFRGHSARNNVRPRLDEQRSLRDLKPEAAAVKIQAAARGRMARKQQRRRSSAGPSEDERNDAATMMQSAYRGHNTRKVVAKTRKEKEAAATKLQAMARGRAAKTKVRRLKGERARQRAREFAASSPSPQPASASSRRSNNKQRNKSRRNVR